MIVSKRFRPAFWCWLGLVGYVTSADVVLLNKNMKARKNGKPYERYATMSVCLGDSLEHPIKRWPLSLAWLVVSIHLFSPMLPTWLRQLDPIRKLAKKVTHVE